MNPEAEETYASAVAAICVILRGLIEWCETMLEGPIQQEAIWHIVEISKTWERFTLAMMDYQGCEL